MPFFLSLGSVYTIILLLTLLPKCLDNGATGRDPVSSTQTAAQAEMRSISALTSSNIARSNLHRSANGRNLLSSSTTRGYTAAATPPPPFTYRIAAASSAKQTSPRPARIGRDFWNYASTQENNSTLYLRSSKKDSGEDAFFATTVAGNANNVAFGVADGVGGWQDSGVDPSDFSHGLCGLMAGTAYMYEGLESGKVLRPQKLLHTAYDAVIGNPRILAGGSTASLAVVDGNGQMEAANLGDSGFLILSPDKVAFRSPAQTHAFNTPYQMSKVPPRMLAQRAIFGGSMHFSETPSQADVTRHEVKHGDIVLFATDGVWDNLSAQDALTVVRRVMMEHGYWYKRRDAPGAETLLDEQLVRNIPKSVRDEDHETFLPGLIASAVMREAKLAGLDRRRDGPFAKEVKFHYPNEPWQGGKPDDIAVVVCIGVEDTRGSSQDKKQIKAKL